MTARRHLTPRDEPTRTELAAAIAAVAARSGGLLAAYLFGSRAHGSERPDSDVDVAVVAAERLSLDALVALETAFEEAVGRRVDLLDLRAASPFLALDVLRGRRVFCRDEELCDELELYVMRRAGDLAPLERERRAMLLGTERA